MRRCGEKKDYSIDTEAYAYGRMTVYSLIPTQAHKIIMVDEVGAIISHNGDGYAGGHKLMVAAKIRAQVRISFKYNHLTVLGFTAATGDPLSAPSPSQYVLARESLKEKVEHVLQKGPAPQAGKWNNNDLKAMLQWYKRSGDRPMPKKRKACVLFALAAEVFTLTASDSRSCVHTYTAVLNLNP
jgi:hypothetical protein